LEEKEERKEVSRLKKTSTVFLKNESSEVNPSKTPRTFSPKWVAE